MIKWILIAVGGAVGSLMRYAVQGWVQEWTGDAFERWTGRTFPIGTLAVNASACLAMGLLTGYFAGPHLLRQEYRIA
ncbi:CrcB family protein, partial [Klebsiella pneumoniae]|uniref:fluoride efflux transporter FluC n=1 Tax=Klebsiella pneumoniae TaxID=573 RepID=UPI003013B4B0